MIICLILLVQEPVLSAPLKALLRALPQVQSALTDIEMTQLQETASQAMLYPQVGLSGTMSNTNQPVLVFGQRLAAQEFEISDFAYVTDAGLDPYPVNHPSSDNDIGWAIDLDYALFDRSRTARIKAASKATDASQAMQELVWQQTLIQFVQKRIQAQGYEASSLLLVKMVKQSLEMETLLAQLYQEGQISKLAYLEVQESRFLLQAQLAEMSGQVHASKVGMDQWLKNESGVVYPVLKSPTASSAGHHSSLVAAQANLQRQEWLMAAEQPLWFPKVHLFSQLEQHQGANVFYQVGIMAKVQLWDGGYQKTRRGVALLAAKQSSLTMDNNLRELRQIRSELETTIQANELALVKHDGAIASIRERWELEKQLVEEGQYQKSKWIETQNQLVQAEMNRIRGQTRLIAMKWQQTFANGQDLELAINQGGSH